MSELREGHLAAWETLRLEGTARCPRGSDSNGRMARGRWKRWVGKRVRDSVGGCVGNLSLVALSLPATNPQYAKERHRRSTYS